MSATSNKQKQQRKHTSMETSTQPATAPEQLSSPTLQVSNASDGKVSQAKRLLRALEEGDSALAAKICLELSEQLNSRQKPAEEGPTTKADLSSYMRGQRDKWKPSLFQGTKARRDEPAPVFPAK